MSSRVSMPTESRTRPGVTPVVQLLGELELAVRGARGVDREAAHVADVREVAEQLEAVDEVPARVDAALQLERDDRALAVAAGTSRARVVPLARLQARVRDPLDLVARLEPLRDRERVLRVPLHAQAQRLQALEEQERVERRDRGADVALVLQAALRMYSRGPQLVGQLREHEAVVARVGLGEAGEAAARRVVERAAVDDDAADRRAVTADELRRASARRRRRRAAAAAAGTGSRACCRSRAGCRCRARSSTTPSKSKMSPFGLPMLSP